MQTRDGGKDLVCLDSDGGKFYVEAKRFTKNRVGIALVQRFVGALIGDSVSRGFIVTTTGFTKPVRRYKKELRYQNDTIELELSDISDVVSWLGLTREKDDEKILEELIKNGGGNFGELIVSVNSKSKG